MNRFGIVRWSRQPEQGEVYVGDYPAQVLSSSSGGPPQVAYYGRKEERDAALHILAGQWPGYTFCPIEITEGVQVAPGPTAHYSINEAGFLPK